MFYFNIYLITKFFNCRWHSCEVLWRKRWPCCLGSIWRFWTKWRSSSGWWIVQVCKTLIFIFAINLKNTYIFVCKWVPVVFNDKGGKYIDSTFCAAFFSMPLFSRHRHTETPCYSKQWKSICSYRETLIWKAVTPFSSLTNQKTQVCDWTMVVHSFLRVFLRYCAVL